MTQEKKLDEFGLIARYFLPLAKNFPGALELMDDAALIDPPDGAQLVVTTDALVAGIHFPIDDSPDYLARKSLRTNLSDIAAMGATPLAYTLTAVLPKDTEETWIATFARALAEEQEKFGIFLAGGDTVSTQGPLTLSITIWGVVTTGQALRRNNARLGDAILVSGSIGDGALGLLAIQGRLPDLSDEERDYLIRRYRLPQPRIDLGLALTGQINAAMDISDGLIADIEHICQASNTGAHLKAAAVPLSNAARHAITNNPMLLQTVLSGGDDYELLFTTAPDNIEKIKSLAKIAGTHVSVIGKITDKIKGIHIVDKSGIPISLNQQGYKHF